MELDLAEPAPVPLKNEQGILLDHIQFPYQFSIGEKGFQVFKGFFFIIVESHMAYPFIGRRYDDIPKRAFREAVMDAKVFAPVLIFGRSHSFDVNEQVMQSSRSGKPGFK